MNIGVVGYSSDQIDATAAHTLLQASFQQLVAQQMGNAPIRIISGLTNIGVPKLAYQIAHQLGYQTVGISAQRALKVNCGIYAVDEQLIVGLEFGDESACLLTPSTISCASAAASRATMKSSYLRSNVVPLVATSIPI